MVWILSLEHTKITLNNFYHHSKWRWCISYSFFLFEFIIIIMNVAFNWNHLSSSTLSLPAPSQNAMYPSFIHISIFHQHLISFVFLAYFEFIKPSLRSFYFPICLYVRAPLHCINIKTYTSAKNIESFSFYIYKYMILLFFWIN